MSDVVSEEIFNHRKSLIEELKKTNKIITARIDYIVRQIAKVLKFKNMNWAFGDMYDNYQDKNEEMAFVENHIDRDDLYLCIEGMSCDEDDSSIIFRGEDYCFNDGIIPTCWLFEPFEDDLIKGRAEYVRKYMQEKEAKEKIIKNIKKKLTKEEKEFLKKQLKG